MMMCLVYLSLNPKLVLCSNFICVSKRVFFVSEAIEINEPFNIGIQGSYIRQPGMVFACFEMMCKKDALYMYQDVNESKHDTTFFRLIHASIRVYNPFGC